jgi:poly(3-hydroxyalkanoate) synthetase
VEGAGETAGALARSDKEGRLSTASPRSIYGTPTVANGLLDSWWELCAAAGLEVLEEMSALLARGPRPLDLPRWLELIATRRPPTWSTPHEIAFETPLARLRDFSTTRASATVPTLVLPPQAGHDSCIVDFSEDQSQMRTIQAAGHDRAFSLDWISATPETAGASIEDYLDTVDVAVDHVGGRVNLIGDCQGGWLATIYASLSPERVNTLTIAGAPIDFHAGEPVIHEVLSHLAPNGDLSFYQTLVALDGGVMKGEHLLGGFILIKPVDEFARQIALLRNLDDLERVARYRKFEDWFKHTEDIPGRYFLWIVRHLFRDNELISRSLSVGDRTVDLRRLDMPLNLFAGALDHITPPDQVFALAEAASTPAEEIRRQVTAGGHLGLFMGHEALRDHWPAILKEVRRHSGGAPA